MNSEFTIGRKKKSKTATLVAVMGWFHLVLLILTVSLKFGIVLYFSAAGWANVIRSILGLFSGEAVTDLFAMNNKEVLLSAIGTGYALYHVALVMLFVLAFRRGVNVGTLLFAVFSLIVLACFTVVGLNFRWT